MAEYYTENPDLIFVGDLHIRESTPSCRKDNFLETLQTKLNWLKNLQLLYSKSPIILITGDIFHTYRPTYYLLNSILDYFPFDLISIPGNHDLPYHNLDLYNRSGLSILERCLNKEKKQIIRVAFQPTDLFLFNNKVRLTLIPYGCNYEFQGKKSKNQKHILLMHEFVYLPGNPPFPGHSYLDAEQMLDKYPYADLIVTGDNHQYIYYEKQNRRLICPGSFTRQTFDQYDYQPKIVYWYLKNDSIKTINVPIKSAEEVFRDPADSPIIRIVDTFSEFLEALNFSVNDFNFLDLLKNFLNSRKFKNQYDKRVAEKILEAVERK